jgi:hypothetical protein
VTLISIHNTTRTTPDTVRSRKTEVQRRSNIISQQTEVLNELWYETAEKIKKLATTTVGYAQKQEKKEVV